MVADLILVPLTLQRILIKIRFDLKWIKRVEGKVFLSQNLVLNIEEEAQSIGYSILRLKLAKQF